MRYQTLIIIATIAHYPAERKMKQNIESSMSGSESSEEDDDEPFVDAKPHVDGESDAPEDEDDDEGLSGFIEEDSVNAVAPELPAEFSMNTYQDLMHHFKIICQLYVHLAVHDPEERQSFMEQSLKGSLPHCWNPPTLIKYVIRQLFLYASTNSATKISRHERF